MGPNKSLGRWLGRQRDNYRLLQQSKEHENDQQKSNNKNNRKITLTSSRIQAMNAVSPLWLKSSKERFWDEKYNELAQYKSHFGHCKVPKNFTSNKSLVKWVVNQRVLYRKKSHTLTPTKKRKLDELGFCWDPLKKFP